MTKQGDLADIRNHLYTKAERLWVLTFWLPFVTQAAILGALLLGGLIVTSVTSAVAVLVPIAVYWIRDFATTVAAKADKCRRLILYSDGLGREIPSTDLALVRSWGIGEHVKEAPFVAPYYASRIAVGPNRLADIVAESAFFTGYLADKVASRMKIVLAISVFLLVAVLYVASAAISQSNDSVGVVGWITRTAASVIALLISGDFALMLKRHQDLKGAAESAVSSCSRLRDDHLASVEQVMQVVEDYNLAVAKGPLLPGKLYKKYKEELNDAYRRSNGNAVSGGR